MSGWKNASRGKGRQWRLSNHGSEFRSDMGLKGRGSEKKKPIEAAGEWQTRSRYPMERGAEEGNLAAILDRMFGAPNAMQDRTKFLSCLVLLFPMFGGRKRWDTQHPTFYPILTSLDKMYPTSPMGLGGRRLNFHILPLLFPALIFSSHIQDACTSAPIPALVYFINSENAFFILLISSVLLSFGIYFIFQHGSLCKSPVFPFFFFHH
ncbi:hypothetical protein SLEP1_g57390 [Rubroshorea leprosula]|uniref:Uncharacterized protein n=1 Tax=Rubroshorea leprosula TaxID=152421 RepID=A0AAV5MQ47_9ROSI|nr:hypothetical protein SLEP1_g57390 [Rubroshorea leprosula]